LSSYHIILKTLIMKITNYVFFWDNAFSDCIEWMLYLSMHAFSKTPFFNFYQT